MSYPVETPDEFVDLIVKKYFNPGDKGTVLAVFNRLLGGNHQFGAAELANIRVIEDKDIPVNDPVLSYLEGFADTDPILGLSDDAFGYPNRDDNPTACSDWEEQMTADMYLLGSVLVHEYTHWDWFLGRIHHGLVIDQPGGYGWEGARGLDKSLAIHNADSYGWFATELFWAVLCGEKNGYDDPDAE